MQMLTTVTEGGQTTIPVQIRRRYNLKTHSKLIWLDLGETISVIPSPEDSIQTLRGMFKQKGLTRLLLEERRRERHLDRKEK